MNEGALRLYTNVTAAARSRDPIEFILSNLYYQFLQTLHKISSKEWALKFIFVQTNCKMVGPYIVRGLSEYCMVFFSSGV